MKSLIPILMILFLSFQVDAQKAQDAASIRREMAKIRQTTDWNNPEAAKKANARIKELSKKLMTTGQAPAEIPQNLVESDMETARQNAANDKAKLWDRMLEIREDDTDWDLAADLREEIAEAYREDENPTPKNEEWFRCATLLLVDLSDPHLELIISQMPRYPNITTLIVTAEKPVSTAKVGVILQNARNYPLEALYIINFGSMLQSIPPDIKQFHQLRTLGLFNNQLQNLPHELAQIQGLEMLYLHNNPIKSILETVSELSHLKELGIAATQISESEILQIQKLLPECKIIRDRKSVV